MLGTQLDNQASRGMTQQPLHAGHQNPWQPVWWGHEKEAANSERGQYSCRDVCHSLQERCASSRARKTYAAELPRVFAQCTRTDAPCCSTEPGTHTERTRPRAHGHCMQRKRCQGVLHQRTIDNSKCRAVDSTAQTEPGARPLAGTPRNGDHRASRHIHDHGGRHPRDGSSDIPRVARSPSRHAATGQNQSPDTSDHSP